MGFKIGKTKAKSYNDYKYFPKDRDELKEILIEQLKKDPNVNLNDIDVSEITNMSTLFWNLDPYNIDISEWDVSKVENMSLMFYGCKNFDCDLSNWDVSNVEKMGMMFYGCYDFKGEGLENWNVSNVKNMTSMFNGCKLIKKNIPGWYKSRMIKSTRYKP